MKTLILVAALAQPAAVPSAPALYSFDDVYRLTVNGAAMGDFPQAAGAQRVAVTPQAKASAAFSIREVPAPEGWLLVFSGMAAAFWVARRRMGYSF